MIYNLLPDSDPFLKLPVPEFDFRNPPVDPIELAESLYETMLINGAVGLAANQCGLPYRAFVLASDDLKIACFNPVIRTAISDHQVDLEEGCLSFPGLSLKVRRPELVEIDFQTEYGVRYTKMWGGWTSRIAQHETDHLNGFVFTSRVSKLKLDMARKKKSKK